jgi:hypothetical protein
VSKEIPTALPAELVHEPRTMAYSGPMTNVSGTKDKASTGDPIPPKCSVIEVHVGELKQLFNAIDPSPFRDKDLDPKAEEFIVGWAKDLPRDATLALVIDFGPDQPCDWPHRCSIGDCLGRLSSCFDEGQPHWRDRSRKPYDRRLGLDVAPS